MTDQLQLDIRERLAYGAENFIEHAGVSTAMAAVRTAASTTNFQIMYLLGERRSGKTHMAIACSQVCSDLGLFPRMIDGRQLAERIGLEVATEPCVLIIDDAHEYLQAITAGKSGEFVSFIERHRVLGSTILLFSALPWESLPCDEHVISRLLPGAGHRLGAPDGNEVPLLLKAMAKQRGMKLSERKLGYVAKRIGREVISIEDYLDRLYQLSRMLGKSARFPTLHDAL